MSLHDVTRAFQQVPSPPTASLHKASNPPLPSSSMSNTSSARPPNYSHPSSAPHANMRPAYMAYPSPMMSHSPVPTMIYPHVMSPSPASPMIVNGPSPQYGQPMWMSVSGPTAQTSGAVMRPVPSPYPAQYMAYPAQGPPPQMYASPVMQNAQLQPRPSNGSQTRDRTPSLMSPIMGHAGISHPHPHPHSHPHPVMSMYPASPVMVHSNVPMMQMQPNYSGPAPAGRGDPRSLYAMMPSMHQQGPGPNHPLPPPHQSGYTPGPPHHYVQPPW